MALAWVLVLGGCGGGPPTDVARTSGPLAEGFQIEPGSALIGPVFPFAGDGGLQVVLGDENDMQRVFEGYVRQAEELGYPVEPRGRHSEELWCSDPDDRATDDDPPEGPFEVECSADGVQVDQWVMSLRGVARPGGGGYIRITGGTYSDTDDPVPSLPDGPDRAGRS